MKKILLIALLVVGCAHRKSHPEWITKQPVSTDYWHGIAMVDISDDNYREEARTLAYQEIASQIETHIQSSFRKVGEEVNLNYKEYSKSIIEARVDIVLPEIELLETYTIEDKYFIFTRLKKDIYYRKIELKKERALNLAVNYMTSAENKISPGSFHYLSKALNEIIPFMDYELYAEYPMGSDQKVNLYSTIYILAEKINDRFMLTCDRKEINTAIGVNKNHIIDVSCIDKITQKPLENITLRAMMDQNNLTKYSITDENGNAQIHLFKITENIPVQYLQISIEHPEIISIFNLTNTESISIKVNVNAPSIYIDISEKNLGESVDNSFIIPAFKAFFAENYSAEFTNIKGQSDFYIVGNVSTKAKVETQNEYGLFQVYADGTFSFFNTSTNKEVYQSSLNNIMGVDFNSHEGAGRNALKKMVNKMETKTFHEIIKGINNFSSQNK